MASVPGGTSEMRPERGLPALPHGLTVKGLPPAVFTISSSGVIKITADHLDRIYDGNEVQVNAWLKGRVVEITGTVDDLGKETMAGGYILLKGESAPAFRARCLFDDQHQELVTGLVPGRKVTVKGTCEGKAGQLLIRDCTLQ